MRKTGLLIVFFLMTWLPMMGQQPDRVQGNPAADHSTVNPIEYGLLQAKDGKERYEILYACHKDAFDYHRPLSYAGIDTIWLDIPDNAKSLPLPYITDFAGVVVFVANNSGKDITLFSLAGEQQAREVKVERSQIDSGDFSYVDELQSGDYLLIVTDRNPWTERIGYGYTCKRQDLLYVRNGKSLNLPVAGYSNPAADPVCSFVPVSTERKTIENITIHRVRNCTNKTYCISLSNQNNVLIRNVHITTPKGKFIADAAIGLTNCSNCTIENVTIDSTYSVPGQYGYAIGMNNVWNTTFIRLKADGAWGVFGTNNVSKTTLRECDVNRFDIHCYGRDAHLVNCVFRNKQTQFSSMYGKVIFDSCHFIDCIPVRIRSSYNAYTPFDIYFRHCVFDATLRYHALVNVMLLAKEPNKRPELAARCWPNVYIEDLVVNLPFLTRRIDIISPSGTLSECKKAVDYISRVEINGLRTYRRGRPEYCDLYITKHRFFTKEPVRVNYKNMDIQNGRIVNLINAH